MSIFVWLMTGIAIWHFAVFVPDRFWGGIVGAFGMATIGALLFGFILAAAGAVEIDDPNIGTMLEGVIGAVIGLGLSYWIGSRRGNLAED